MNFCHPYFKQQNQKNKFEKLKTFITNYNSARRHEETFKDVKTIYIANNIDCSGETLTTIKSPDGHGFNHVFDGDGHTISNFKVTNLSEVGTGIDTGNTGFKVLALFPKVAGGKILNVEFKDFSIEETGLTEDFINESNAGGPSIRVGLVGYSRSAHEASEDGVYQTSYYKDVKLTNMTINLGLNGRFVSNSEFPVAVGLLITTSANPNVISMDTFTDGSCTLKFNEAEVTNVQEKYISK